MRKSGSIVPAGPVIRSTAEAQVALTLHVFPGADGSFTLYEDQGTDMGYARGEFSRIPIVWDDAARRLTIGARKGAFPGMAHERPIEIVLHDGEEQGPVFDRAPVRSVTYAGRTITLELGGARP